MNNLKIIALGGWDGVTANMFVYETNKDILIVDCGIGFPEEEMLGVDLVIPDVDYLLDKKEKIRGIVISHGHEDHVGALPYILPQLPNVPIFAPRWAKALAELKFREFGLNRKVSEFDEKSKVDLGCFSVEFIPATHSIPDTYHLAIKTPIGVFYHAADFKLDLTPVMGKSTDQVRIKKIGQDGVFCLLSDCLRSEVTGFTPSESKLEDVFEREIQGCQGKFFVTTFSSNISRLKQAIDVSLRHQRKILLVGRSVKQNIRNALKLKYIQYPANIFVTERNLSQYQPQQIAVIIAGAQGQTGSSLTRLVAGKLRDLAIKPNDKVVFSSDYIPGNETAIYSMIDNLYRLGAEVSYTDIKSDIHVSGHGSQGDLGKLLQMVNPKYVIPIGGNFRHMAAYKRMAKEKGYKDNQILLPDNNQVIEFSENQVNLDQTIEARKIMVDALGIGDVGNVVLRDRKALAEEGIVVAIITIDQATGNLIGESEIVSRGFVYIKENFAILNGAKREIAKVLGRKKPLSDKQTAPKRDLKFLRTNVQNQLERYFFDQTGRRPMILTVIIEA